MKGGAGMKTAAKQIKSILAERISLIMDRRKFLLATGVAATTAWMNVGQGHAREILLAAAGEPALKSEKSKIGLEKRLAQYAASVHYKDLPSEIVQACKRLLLDALACAFGAVGSAPATIAEATFRKAFGSGGVASIIGSAQLIATEGAALVNGVLVRDLDLNDVYYGYDPSHPSEIIPPAIACCEEAGRNGRDLIEAMVIGYETDLRLNDAFSWSSRGFHALSHGAFVIPLVAGKAWRMPEEQVAHAVGISGAHQLTSLAINYGVIGMVKSLAPGHTAMDSLFDTRLAAAGFTGATNTIEWMTANIKPSQTSVSVDLDPRRYQLLNVGFKRFPLQAGLQSTTEAGVNLHPLVEGQTDEIHEIIAETYPATIARGVADPEKYRPETRETADHSMPICLAMALLDGDVSVKQFHDNRWKAREVLALANKVKVNVGESLVAKMPKGQGSNVEVRFSSGRVLKESVEIPEGDPARPISRPSLERKFRQFADPVLGEAGSRKVIAFVDNIEEVKDVRMFTEALRGHT
jgi:2-methylcitrate dehydratase